MSREIINSIKATLYDRVSSPLYGTFIFVWLLSNWKVVYVTFFADEKLLRSSTRLDWIVKYFEGPFNFLGFEDIGSYWQFIWIPIIWTFIIIVIFPGVLIGFDYAILNYKKIRLSIKQKIEGESVLNVQDSLEIKSMHVKLERSYTNELEKHSNKEQVSEKRILQLEIELNQAIKNNQKIDTKKIKLETLNKSLVSTNKKLNLKNSVFNQIMDDFIKKIVQDGNVAFDDVDPIIQKIIKKNITSNYIPKLTIEFPNED